MKGAPRNRGRLALGAACGFLAISQSTAGSRVQVWDTGSPLAGEVLTADRGGWTSVPSELFEFEADPLKAASDPGYYGREYSFAGDVVVENPCLTAVLQPGSGRLLVLPRREGNRLAGLAEGSGGGLELVLTAEDHRPVDRVRCEIVRNAGDEVVLRVWFPGGQGGEASVLFSFGRDEIIEVLPAAALGGVRVNGAWAYGLVPEFGGDDLLFGPMRVGGADRVWLPVEGVFVGLLEGEGSELVLTWAPEAQRLALCKDGTGSGEASFDALEFAPSGRGFNLALLSARGIWHREPLKPAYLEKDVGLEWRRPFPARWKTQLLESGVPTTFAFRDAAGPIWRGVSGSYAYPVWFEGETAMLHLSKKVPPRGEAVIYALEGQDTPDGVRSPVDIIKATLGRELCRPMLDVAGRKLRTHHRRGGDGVHRACTCGCTEAIQAIFEAGREVEERAVVEEALEDMNFFVRRHVERIEEYQRFAVGLTGYLRTTGPKAPAWKNLCADLEATVRRIPEECAAQGENMKSLVFAEDLTRRTLALTERQSAGNLAVYMELLNEWRAMGGAQDYVLAQCHVLARKVAQDAGYLGAQDAAALPVVREVRERCRQVLRNPDGYEIWANY
ncbi:MAG: hypothetical protein H7A45_14605 [Verrucomicrobiales bacterium]|nr:hypothetical protein [Verrucomicrobiales bacterium]